MKKHLCPLGLILAFLLLTAGAYAAVSGDSIISLSYLQNTFFPQAVQTGEETANKALQETYDSAKKQLDAAQGGGSAGLYSGTLQRQEWPDGQIVTLSTGAGFLMLEGSANVVHTGAVVDVTDGAVVPSGESLKARHRYLVAEDTAADFVVTSKTAVVDWQGTPVFQDRKSVV